jgi:hypothetical protein
MPLIKSFLSALHRRPPARRLAYLVVLVLIVASEVSIRGTTRRTFLFPSIGTGAPQLETRFLPFWGDREAIVARYVQETLLGPVSLGSGFLFTPGTRLESVLLRKGIAYIHISEDGALPLPPDMDLRKSLAYFQESVVRNFSFIKEVRLFIGGERAYDKKIVPALQDTHEKK